MNPPTTTAEAPGDGELLTLAAGGDRAAFGQLNDRPVRPGFWQAYAVVSDDVEDEDIRHEAGRTQWQHNGTILTGDVEERR